jgi:ribosomal protein S17
MTEAQTRAKVVRTLVGKVVSDARAKTVTVLVERLRQDRGSVAQVPCSR